MTNLRIRVRASFLESDTQEKESAMMEYVAPIIVFMMVLTPLYIPIGVTAVDVLHNWRQKRRSADLMPSPHPQRRRPTLAVELD